MTGASVAMTYVGLTGQELKRIRHIRAWLGLVIFLVAMMILVGGATRLTDSGLSITEWQLISGVIPPLTEAGWEAAFAKYRTIPEYEQINFGMSLAEFRTIYWWEWSHRFLGRAIGLVYCAPLIWFWWRGWLPTAAKPILALLAVMGAGQGFLGWYMVQSGLVDRVDVSHYRLAAHLLVAFIILILLNWAYLSFAIISSPILIRGGPLVIALFGLILFQIIVGALVAGLDAGLRDNSWPLVDGRFIPRGLIAMDPWWLNFLDNPRSVQFLHRVLAYLILLFALLTATVATIRGWKATKKLGILSVLVVGQAGLGVVTLIHQVPLDLALLHQAGAVIVVLAVSRLAHCYFGGWFV